MSTKRREVLAEFSVTYGVTMAYSLHVTSSTREKQLAQKAAFHLCIYFLFSLETGFHYAALAGL